jgi:hypothetical protein
MEKKDGKKGWKKKDGKKVSKKRWRLLHLTTIPWAQKKLNLIKNNTKRGRVVYKHIAL